MGFIENYISDSQSCGEQYELSVQLSVGAEVFAGLNWNGNVETECPAGLEADNPLWTFTIVNDGVVADEVFGPYHAGNIPGTITLTIGPLATIILEINSSIFLRPTIRVAPASPIQEFSGQLKIRATLAAEDQCENAAQANVLQSLGFANPTACFSFAEATPGSGEYIFTDCSTSNGCSSGITGWLWAGSSADGQTLLWSHSGQTPPNYTYAQPGIYTVSLKVVTGCGSHTITQTIEHFTTANCLALGPGDFANEPWILDTNNDLLGIKVESAVGSSILSIDTRPAGEVSESGGPLLGAVVWSVGNNRYEPSGTINLPNGTYSVEIPTFTVTLNSGQICQIGYTGEYRVAVFDSCSQLSANDWLYLPWNLDPDGYLTSVDLVIAPGSIIATVGTYPNGVLKDDTGSVVDTMTWNGTNYVPLLGSGVHLIIGTWTVEILGISVTTTLGQTCTHDFIHGELGTGNAFPTSAPVTLDEADYQEAETATVSYTYFDADGDAEDVASTVANIVWKSYDGPTGSAGETVIQTGGLTYVIQPADSARYISATVSPYALAGNSPGAASESPRSAVLELAFEGTTSMQTGFRIQMTCNAAKIDWGDGSALEGVDFLGAVGSITHDYASPGVYDWKVYAPPNDIKRIDLNLTNSIEGTLDISSLTDISQLRAHDNSSLTSVVMPTSNAAAWTFLYIYSTGITTLDLSGNSNLGGAIWLHLNSSLSSVTFPTSTAIVTQLYLRDCALTGTLNIGGMTGLGGFFNCYNNTGLTGITFPTTSQPWNNWAIYNCNITGTLDISVLQQLGGSINFRDNPNMTGLTLPTASTVTPTQIYGYNTGVSSLDFSGWGSNFGANTTIQLQNNPSLTSVTFPTTTNAIGDVFIHTCNLTGTLDISGLSNVQGNFQVQNNSLLTGVTFPASNTNILTSIVMNNCNLTGTVDMSGMTGWTPNFQCHTNPNLTSLTFPSSTTAMTQFLAYLNNLTGTIDVSNLTGLGGIFKMSVNPNLTSITFPTSTQTFTEFSVNDNNLTGTIDVSNLSGFGGTIIQFQNNALLTGITFPAASSAIMSNLSIYGTDITGTLDMSGFTNVSGIFQIRDNTNMTNLILPSGTGNINSLFLYNNNQNGVYDISGLTFSSAVSLRMESNNWTAAEVNEQIVDCDTYLPNSGTGTLQFQGTNAAPDATSGGFDGTAAATNLIVEGYSVTTS